MQGLRSHQYTMPFDPEKIHIVFMGTPPFAVASLRALREAGMNIRGVVTSPDKPAGRGQKMRSGAVKEYVLSLPHAPEICQPLKLNDPLFIDQMKRWNPALIVVVAFRILPGEVWQLPALGTFNLHASLLPQYRGAAPINWAVINGEKKTGVTTFFINDRVDTGNIILQEETAIGDDETAGSLSNRLMVMGASLVVRTVRLICSGEVKTTGQQELTDGLTLRTAPKISRENSRIRWDQTAWNIHNLIRGLSPQPGAWCRLAGKQVTAQHMKIFGSALTGKKSTGQPGSFVTDDKTFLEINTADQRLAITDLQAENKRRMGIREFLRGFDLNRFTSFE